MFQPVFVLRKCRPSVVWRIDVDALHLARKLLLERLERQQVVTKDQPVVEQIAITHPLRRMIRPLRLLQQNSWLQLRPLVLADPGEFEFLPVRHASFFFSPSRPVASRSSRSSLGVADFRRFSTVLICSAAGMSSGKVPPMRLIALRTSLPISWRKAAGRGSSCQGSATSRTSCKTCDRSSLPRGRRTTAGASNSKLP